MSVMTVEGLIIQDAGNPDKKVSFLFNGGVFEVTAADGDVDEVVVNFHGTRVRLTETGLRLDGNNRVEIHADAVTRIDAGGTGITYTPTLWTNYMPAYSVVFLRAEPEHPDTGGETYSLAGSGSLDDHADDYAQRFPPAP